MEAITVIFIRVMHVLNPNLEKADKIAKDNAKEAEKFNEAVDEFVSRHEDPLAELVHQGRRDRQQKRSGH